MKFFILAGFLVLVPLAQFPYASDDVEALIEKEKTEEETWEDPEGNLPPTQLLGADQAVLLYSSSIEASHGNILCTSVEFDEIMEGERDAKPQSETVVNIKIPRFRDSLSESCLIRPGDPLLAVGPGWQEMVVTKKFVVRREKPVCPNDSPYSLWVTYDGELPSDPLYFSTDIDLPVAPNDFKLIDEFPVVPLTKKMRSLLSKELVFSDEYEATVYQIQSPNCDHLVTVKKKEVSPDDSDLANEIILNEKDGWFEVILMEQVDPRKGSGHLSIEGLFDFNGDKILDLFIRGDHQGCPYQVLLKGRAIGFDRMELPIRSCAC